MKVRDGEKERKWILQLKLKVKEFDWVNTHRLSFSLSPFASAFAFLSFAFTFVTSVRFYKQNSKSKTLSITQFFLPFTLPFPLFLFYPFRPLETASAVPFLRHLHPHRHLILHLYMYMLNPLSCSLLSFDPCLYVPQSAKVKIRIHLIL